jgi:hypothetical protein
MQFLNLREMSQYAATSREVIACPLLPPFWDAGAQEYLSLCYGTQMMLLTTVHDWILFIVLTGKDVRRLHFSRDD